MADQPGPDSLRTLFKRSTAKRGEWNLSMLEVALGLHADAWQADVQAKWQTLNHLIERLEEAEADNAALREMLRRLSEWDHMDTAADGTYWRSEIAAALASQQEKP